MVEVCSIASGSNGNCYYIGDAEDAVLIDAGISCRQILLRFESRQLDPARVKALFISHEHIDHIRGARVLASRLKIPVFMTRGTYNQLPENLKPVLFRFIENGQSVTIGSMIIHPFLKSHDAAEPCSFRIEMDGHSIGVITDLGIEEPHAVEHLRLCKILFLESNYDEKSLWEGPYPWPLKKRIASSSGHLSNGQALNIVEQYAGDHLETLFLSHLSGENNSPDLVAELFGSIGERYKVVVTSRHEAGEVYRFG